MNIKEELEKLCIKYNEEMNFIKALFNISIYYEYAEEEALKIMEEFLSKKEQVCS